MVSGEGLWGFQTALVAPMTVLTLLLLRFGASQLMISAILAVETGFVALPQWIGNYLVPSAHGRKGFLIRWHLVAPIPLLFLMGAVAFAARSLPAAVVRWSLLIGFGAHTLLIGAVVAVWTDWTADLFGRSLRGTVYGASVTLFSLTGSVAALVSGRVIAANPGDSTFGWLYLWAGAAALLSMICFAAIRDPARLSPDRPIRLTSADLLASFWESLRDRQFRRYLLGRLLSIVGFCMVPYLAVYYSSHAGGSLSPGAIVSAGAALTAGSALASMVFGRIGDRGGHRIGMLASVGAQVVVLIFALFTRGIGSCILAYAFAGVARGGGMVSGYGMMIETCPHDRRLSHLTVGGLVLSVASIGSPLLAGGVAGSRGLPFLFAACLAISAVAFLWCLLWVEDPRRRIASSEAAD